MTAAEKYRQDWDELDPKVREALKRLYALDALERQAQKLAAAQRLEAMTKGWEAEERARRSAMPWYKRLWEDFDRWRVQEQFQGEVDKLHSEWIRPEKEPPGGGFG
jgi:hypothetical protein